MTDPNTNLLDEIVNTDPEPTPDVNYFTSLVGEDRRYKSGDELARGKLNADKQIKTLEDELHTAREQTKLLKDLVEGIRNVDENDEVTPASQPNTPPTVDVEKIVDQKLERNEQERVMRSNEQESLHLLDQQLGSRSQTATALKAFFDVRPELRETMTNLSAQNPQAFVNLFNSYNSPSQPSVTAPGTIGGPSAHAVAASTGIKGYSFYEEMHKKDPEKFKTQAVQDEMVVAAARAEAEGRDFFNS